jgi:hypothetical protein
MKHLLFIVALLCLCGPFATARRGVVMDSMCAKLGGHSVKGYSSTGTNNPRDCTIACVRRGAKYVLRSAGKTYPLSDQRQAARYAGQSIEAMIIVALYGLTFIFIRRRRDGDPCRA